jgi:hypothetical protein
MSPSERVLGVADNCIVDVEVPVGDQGASGMENPAFKLAELMLAKVAVAQR